MFPIALALGLWAGIGAGDTAGEAGQSTWVAQIGGQGAEIVFGLAETSDRRLCATGTFWGRAEFGEPSADAVLLADSVQDIYVACYADDGNFAWATQFGTGRGDEPRAIAATPGGDLVLTGFFADEFGAGKTASITADVNADVFLTRLDPRGNEVWARKFGGKLADNGNALGIAADGSILLAGSFQDVMMFPRDGKLKKIASAGSRDAFLFQLSPDGEVLWAARFGGTGSDEATAVTAGRNGEVLVAGTFHGEARVTDESRPMTAIANSDAFLLAFSADGELLWSRQISGQHQELVGGLAADSRGRIFLTGTFQNKIGMPDGSSLESQGSTDVFVARFAPDGALERAVSFGGKQIEQVYALAMTPQDTLLLTGNFQGEADFAPGSRTETLQAAGASNMDAFLLELDDDGNYRSARSLGGDGIEIGFGVRSHEKGSMAVAGLFSGSLDVGARQVEPRQARGKTDVFVARLRQP